MTTGTLTYNTKLRLDEGDLRTLHALLRRSADAYNECAKFLWDHCDIPLNIRDVHRSVYDWMRERYPSLKAQQVIRIYKDVLAAIRSIKSNRHKEPECPKKVNLSMRLDKRLYDRLTPDSICLSGLENGKRKEVRFESYGKLRDMFASYTTTDPLLFIRNGEAWLSVSFNVPQKPVRTETAVGVDLGLKRFVTTSDGVVIDDKPYKASRRRLRYLKRKLMSKGTKSARRKLRRLRVRERNISKDFLLRSANRLLSGTSADIIVLEDLTKLKRNTSRTEDGHRRKRHNSMMSQAPFSAFRNVLTYKAQLVGKRVETVSPTWTSQTDSRTGRRDGTRRGCRYYCSDGVVLDADWNAAVNIGKRANHPLSNTVPLDGRLTFLSGRPQSTGQTHVSPHQCGLASR